MNHTKNGDGMYYLIVLWRCFFFYSLIAASYRLMGKREMGELSIMDFIVSIFLGEIVAISIENYDKSILFSLIPILFLVFLEILISYLSMKHKKIRTIIEGKPSVIISKGNVNFAEMKKQRYNINDLLSQLRNNSIKSIREVDYAILETNGKLSIFKRKDDFNRDYPLPLIVDGKLSEEVLIQIHQSKDWLLKELTKQNMELKDIFYAFYQHNQLYVIEKDKIK